MDGSGVVIRLHEFDGCDARAELTVAPLPGGGQPVVFREAQLCNLMEEDAQEIACDNGKIRLDFKPFEIKTLLLR